MNYQNKLYKGEKIQAELDVVLPKKLKNKIKKWRK